MSDTTFSSLRQYPRKKGEETSRYRFIYEAKAASVLDHPNICTIHRDIKSSNILITDYFVAVWSVSRPPLQ